MKTIYILLFLVVGCAHLHRELPGGPVPLDEYQSAYAAAGRLPGTMVSKTLLGASVSLDGPGSSSSSPTFNPCVAISGLITTTFCNNLDANFTYFNGSLRVQGGNGVYIESGSLTVRTDMFQVNSTQVLMRSNSLTQFSVGPSGSAWLDVQSAQVAIGNALSLNANVPFKVNTTATVNTAPTISSGFGTSPSVTTSNGTASFTINVGTGGVATSGVIGLPTVTNGWVCQCDDITTPGANKTRMTATSVSSCTVSNVAMSTGAAAAWTASDILHCTAVGR